MFKLKFTCKELTGDTVHTINIDDSSLSDTWAPLKVTEIPKELGDWEYSHFVNVWCDENDEDIFELMLSVYPYIKNDRGEIESDMTDWVNCKIIEVDSGDSDEVYSNEGKPYFYEEQEDEMESECPVCERACHEHDIIDAIALDKHSGCTDCIKDHELFNVYYNDSGESRSGLVEIMAYNEEHVRERFNEVYEGAIIDEIE
jgi:hypothetical protein